MKSFRTNATLIFAALMLVVAAATTVATAQSDVGSSLRVSLTLNGTWQFVLNQSQNQIPQSGWQPMRVPTTPYMDGTVSVWYKQSTYIDPAWTAVSGRRFFLELEKCGHYCAIYANGQFIGEHYGQYAPYEVEVTSAIVGGSSIEFEIYAHIADSTYARPGPPINQSSCPQTNPNCMAMSYRPLGQTLDERNWVGIVGDITFSWRGTNGGYISGVQILPSVRNSTLTANITVVGAGPNATVSASVLDQGKDVLDIPAQPVVDGAVSLVANASVLTLWQPNQPKLYTLLTKLIDKNTADHRFDRFGFREVWINGKTLLLNGSPLWMAGNYRTADDPLRFANDRRPLAMQLDIQQQSGVNADTFHWDTSGREWYDLRAEMGVPTMEAMYCNGPPVPSEAEVDSEQTWTAYMQQAAAEVAQTEQNNPAIMFWRPFDLPAPGAGGKAVVDAQIKAAMLAVNPTLLFADNTDIDEWSQSVVDQQNPNTCDNGSAFAQKLASETKPLIIKELYGWDAHLPCEQSFLATMYGIAYTGGGVGLFTGELQLIDQPNFTPTWPSQSGIGNRPTSSDSLPDWISRQWTATAWANDFGQLWTVYTGLPFPLGSPIDGEYVATGLPASAPAAFLTPPSGIPVGVVTAQIDPEDDAGTGDLFTPDSGENLLSYGDSHQEVNAPPPSPF